MKTYYEKSKELEEKIHKKYKSTIALLKRKKKSTELRVKLNTLNLGCIYPHTGEYFVGSVKVIDLEGLSVSVMNLDTFSLDHVTFENLSCIKQKALLLDYCKKELNKLK